MLIDWKFDCSKIEDSMQLTSYVNLYLKKLLDLPSISMYY